MKVYKVDGRIFVRVKEVKPNSCHGCAAQYDNALRVVHCADSSAACDGKIFKEVVFKEKQDA